VSTAQWAGLVVMALTLGCGRVGYDGLGENGPDAGPVPDTLLAAGACHTCRLQGAALDCWGCNDSGQVGNGNTDDEPSPSRITPLSSARTLAVGGAHSCAIKGSSLSCWGSNADGQLGTGSPDDEVHPTSVTGGLSWRSVAGGAAHTCGIDSAGVLHCWGANADGQLGLGSSSEAQREPMPVASEALWRQGSAGGQSTCFLAEDRSLWCWGGPPFAAAPAEVDGAPHDDVAVGGDSICAVRSHDGQLRCTCADCGEPDWEIIPSAVGWSSVCAGDAHRCAIDRAGALWCWGDNADGQLGLGDTDARSEPVQVGEELDWEQIAAGGHHTCGIRGGITFCWGANGRGELGQGAAGEPSPVPLQL